MKLPSKLILHIVSTHKDKGQKWLDELPSLIQSLEKKWGIENLKAFENLSWNYVASGLRNKLPVVLKIGIDQPSIEKEFHALKAFSHNCVEVLEYSPNDCAILLERAKPGKELIDHYFDERFMPLRISCELALGLKNNQSRVHYSFDTIPSLMKKFDQEWKLEDLKLARSLAKELIESDKSEKYVIHGDLHRGNILSHGKTWLVIDPKGYLGTLYNEVWPFIHEPEWEIAWAAKFLKLDAETLTRWCFVQTILSAVWGLEDGIDTTNIVALAQRFKKMIRF